MATGWIPIEQLIDIVQNELTFSGLFPKILPDPEVKRLVREHALEYFYKNYQFSTMRIYFYLPLSCFNTDLYTQYKYFVMPEEFESVIRIVKISDPSLFRLGIQAPHLSINLGVTNQPFLTSFVTTVGELGVYRSVLSAFSDEINKMTKQTLKFDYNHINKRLHILTDVDTNLILECFVRIEQEELFDLQIFKDYVIGLCKVRQGEAIGRFNFNMPGNFQYNAADMITQGQALVDKVVEKIKGETQSGWFKMSR
jgi:hypothetical protein